MTSIKDRLAAIDWQTVAAAMHEKGLALVLQVLSPAYCDALIGNYDDADAYRKTITMERYRFGLDEYKYFKYPLPDVIQTIRTEVYPKLALIANKWMNVLKIEKQFPDEFEELQQLCHNNGQTKPTVLILKYGKGGHNTLHQDLYGDIFFPIQLVLFLNEPDADYTGGKFVLTQQTP